jgi:phytoene dehydrogenase-like protein
MPCASDVSDEEWREFEKTGWERAFEHYAKSCNNFTKENLIAVNVQPPTEWQNEKGFVNGDFCNGHMSREQLAHKRPFPEAAQYQTEIENVYMCGPGQHPTGGVSAAPGYNAYKKLAEAFDLKYKPWETHPRGY